MLTDCQRSFTGRPGSERQWCSADPQPSHRLLVSCTSVVSTRRTTALTVPGCQGWI